MNRLTPFSDVEPALHREYGRLRAIAAAYLARERRAHTLQPTALVHEGLTRLFKNPARRPQDSAMLVLAVARAMRMALVDHARKRAAAKRSPGAVRVSLDQVPASAPANVLDLVALDAALERLAMKDPRLARIVELRFFAGLTEPEIAAFDGVSTRTITRAWAFARLWLARELDVQSNGDAP